jgi:Tfp pilus assembly PilM family ATPase
MYIMLLPFGTISPDQLRQQLEREYELRINLDEEADVDPGTPEERKRALLSVCVIQMARLPPHER